MAWIADAEGHVAQTESRESLWQAVRQTPVALFDSPWRAVLERAVAYDPARRYERRTRSTARTTSRVR